MEELIVDIPGSPASQYPITFDTPFRKKIEEFIRSLQPSRIAFVVDKNVMKHWGSEINDDRAVIIEQQSVAEKQKDVGEIARLWSAYKQCNLDRRSLVVHIGGGATIDAASFATSTYMRGIPFINIPTTLLSQVDSSIGGKNGINQDGVKNLVGTFSQPRAVVIDISFLSTLPVEEYRSGFAEILKHAMIQDRTFFEQLETLSSPAIEDLLPIIQHSCLLKAKIVSLDPHESGIRKILNFGHTVGHALESYSHSIGKPLLHGEAIAIGMVGEAWIASKLKLISVEELARIEKLIKAHSLPVRQATYPQDELIETMKSDKKNRAGELKFSLLKGLGHCGHDIDVAEGIVRESLIYIGNE